MIEPLPSFISIIFILTALTAVLLFYKASGSRGIVLVCLLLWLVIQGLIALTGFYSDTLSFPPRFVLAVLPPLITVIFLIVNDHGKKFLDSLDVKILTYLQTVRIPVEIVLYYLYKYGYIPELMTFEGRNFDILAGISAPFIAYFGFTKNMLNKKIILIWNIVCLLLLLNIVFNAVLSAPFSFQMFAFDQPNKAVFYFPFIWLPSCIVPIVLISHLASIRQIINDKIKFRTN